MPVTNKLWRNGCRARSCRGEVCYGAGGLEAIDCQSGVGEPAAQLVDGAAGAEDICATQGANRQILTQPGAAHHRVADQPAARLEATGDLGARRRPDREDSASR